MPTKTDLEKTIRKYERELAGLTRKLGGGESGRATIVKRHPSIRANCERCGGPHTLAQHRSHGEGSFMRTHATDFFPKARKSKTVTSKKATSTRAAVKAWPRSAAAALSKELAKVQGEVAARKQAAAASAQMEDLKAQLKMARAELRAATK